MPRVDPSGSLTSVPGFRAGATFAGLKTFGEGKLDLAIMLADRPCNAAATFTRNRLHSATVDVNRAKLADGRAQAVVVNAGIANSSTGERGFSDAVRLTEWVAARHALHQDDVLVCSTGVIGVYLPMDRMEHGIRDVVPTADGGADFASAIMTTDTRAKRGSIGFGPYTLGGCAKGSGMIHPNMATMLAFLATDAPIGREDLQRTLSSAVDLSFNMVSVDGDTSPSDSVLLFSRDPGPGSSPIEPGSGLFADFEAALLELTTYLAREIARDGEGASRLMEITVTGAASDEDARKVVRLLSTSYLLKSAVHGADPNWGRITAVIGRSEAGLDEDALRIDLCGVRVYEAGGPTQFDEAALSRAMAGDVVPVAVRLGAGACSATGWGCDLTPEYVHINADYHT